MGNFIAKIISSFGQIQDAKILMVGLDAAGKTTILYKLKIGENVTTIPTIGFNVEGIETANNVRMTVWDVGGQDKIRRLWKHYFMGSDAVVFVVDSADRMRIEEAREELEKVMEDPDIKSSCRALLVLANKQDLPNAMTASEIAEGLKLGKRNRGCCEWYIQSTIATSGDGLHEGIHWLSNQLKKK